MSAVGRLALILAGGDVDTSPALDAAIDEAGLVIAADGGLRHARTFGLTPSAIVGDFDSALPRDLEAFPDVPRERHPTAKGELDLELAMRYARDRGAERLVVAGAFGSRLDQTLAALLICARLQRGGVRCTLLGTGIDAHPLAPGETVAVRVERATTFSVVALDDGVVASVLGARWETRRESLPFGVGLGVSNVVDREAHVTCHEGLLVVIVERNADAG